MPPEEAVDYLLWQLDLLAEAIGDAHHLVDDMGMNLTAAERRVMICLYNARGNVRCRDQIHAALIFGGSGNETEPQNVNVRICNLRRKLPADVGAIKTYIGLGYALHLAPPDPPA